MSVSVRKRYTIGAPGWEPAPWLDDARAKPTSSSSSAGALAFGLVAALCLAWWAAAPEVRVSSAWLESGRVLSCRYLTSTKVVERQFLLSPREAARGVCPLVRFV